MLCIQNLQEKICHYFKRANTKISCRFTKKTNFEETVIFSSEIGRITLQQYGN